MPEPQTLPGVVEVIVGMLFTVTVTELDVAVVGEAHGSFEVKTQETTFPFDKVELV